MSQQLKPGIFDGSAVDAGPARAGGVQGAAEELARSSAAVARFTVLPAGRRVEEHVHDHPYLSLHLLGSYLERGEDGEAAIDGPAAAFHPAGSAHGDLIGARGLATVVIEFDQAWLRGALRSVARLDRSRYWIGGELGRRASRLARIWLAPAAYPQQRFEATRAFLAAAANDVSQPPTPPWLDRLQALTDGEGALARTADLARALGVTGDWLARAYRESRGEGLGAALRRRRVETAARLIEQTDLSLAAIACETGFCDQSHMNRAFNALIGRTPAALRVERLGLSGAA